MIIDCEVKYNFVNKTLTSKLVSQPFVLIFLKLSAFLVAVFEILHCSKNVEKHFRSKLFRSDVLGLDKCLNVVANVLFNIAKGVIFTDNIVIEK